MKRRGFIGTLLGAAAAIVAGIGLPKASTRWTPIREVNGPVRLDPPAYGGIVPFRTNAQKSRILSRPHIVEIHGENHHGPIAHYVTHYEASLDNGRTWFRVEPGDLSMGPVERLARYV